MSENWIVYILCCADNTFYTGITNNLTRRLKQHNQGGASRYTRSRKRRPLRLVYQEQASTKGNALRREYAIKKLSRSQKEQLIHTGKNHLRS
jgi:predicted GIY-YIG superfamily endonuclease